MGAVGRALVGAVAVLLALDGFDRSADSGAVARFGEKDWWRGGTFLEGVGGVASGKLG